jgi:hypothetical protein
LDQYASRENGQCFLADGRFGAEGGSTMAGLMLTAEQIRNAPPEVRRWLASIVAADSCWTAERRSPPRRP